MTPGDIPGGTTGTAITVSERAARATAGLVPGGLMLAAAAQRTSRLRLGTLITILSLYHPMRIIEEAVTLDQLSGGRLDLGVGRGVSPAELAFHCVSGEEEAQGRPGHVAEQPGLPARRSGAAGGGAGRDPGSRHHPPGAGRQVARCLVRAGNSSAQVRGAAGG